MIARSGMQPGSLVESTSAVPAPPSIAEAFDIEEGALVSTLRRVRTADGRRVVDVTDWCRIEHFSPDELAALGEGSIYTALSERGLAVDHGVARLSPRNADEEIARRLDVPLGTLLITIDQVDRTADSVTVLVSREHHMADAFTFTLLQRGPGEDES